MSADQLLGRLEADGIEHLWVVYHDYSGRSCAKTVPRERFEAVAERGVVFAHANLSMRMDDVQPADATFLADSGDFLAVPDPVSYARVPHQPATARVHVFMRADDLSPWPGCPRTRLGRILDAYAERGMSVRAGFEPEFFLFRRGDDGEYVPADRDGMYTVRGLDRHNALWRSVIDDMRAMDVTVEQLGKEYGPAQYEGTARYAEALRAVDNHLLFKDTLHARARESGLVASFMPKPFEHLPGCGLHVHLSLWNAAGERELSCGVGDEALSEVGRRMAAGLLAHARGLSGVGSPIVNSYKRLQPGSWAPAHVGWGVGNRAALVRVPGTGPRGHLEYRSGDNASNPFVWLTALLAAGLDGIERGLALPPPIDFDIGHMSEAEVRSRGIDFLPRSLSEALDAFESDSVLTGALGPIVGTEHLKLKRSELSAYDLHVHPWERRMYLEHL